MRNNDDPIKESKIFRKGIENLIENDGINNDYSSDLHNCSNDLSGRGSVIEEVEHAQFAQRKREAMQNKTTYSYTWQSNRNSAIKTKSNTGIIAIIFVAFFIFATITEFLSMTENLLNDYYLDSSVDMAYEDYENQIDIKEQLFLDSKNNIIINASILSNGVIILDIENENVDTFNNIQIQTIFYDSENKPIHISENYINTLFGFAKHLCEITDVPEFYERFEFLITQPYITNFENINYTDLEVNAIQNMDGDFEISVTNNSTILIDDIEVVAIYYKDEKIVQIRNAIFFDVKSGDTEYDTIYNFTEMDNYDSVKFLINDAYISE